MEKQIHSDSINELVVALTNAQGSILKAKEGSKNPFFKSKYANLESVWDACREALSKNGLAVFQTMDYEESRMILVTTLAHSSGQWMKSYTPIPHVKQDPQSVGSAITYMRRYSLASIVGIATADDDGEEASKPYRSACKANSGKIKELKMLLNEDSEFKTRFEKYLDSSNHKKLEDLPEKVIDSAIKTTKERRNNGVIEHLNTKEA